MKKLKPVKRILSAALAAVCVFFTGCNSVILNGDLSFQAYPAETVPAIELNDKIPKENGGELDYAKYDIAGENAFYILPNHENRPDRVIDFHVLDYNSNGEFVYCYLTPYYGNEKKQNGLDGTEKTGTVPEDLRQSHIAVTPKEGYTNNVLVLMSYNPSTYDYKVFYSHLILRSKESEFINEQGNSEGDVGPLTATTSANSLMANALFTREEYFLFDEQVAYIFDKNGNMLLRTDYSSSIAQEVNRLKKLAKEENGWDDTNLAKAEATISDVVMDDTYLVYIPITLEIDPDMDITDAEEEDIENTMYMSLITCFDVNLTDKNGRIAFRSVNQNWNEQVDLWVEEASNQIFDSQKAVESFMQGHTFEKIKTGQNGSYPDNFDVFHSNELMMDLAGCTGVDPFTLWEFSSDHTLVKTHREYMDTLISPIDVFRGRLLSSWITILNDDHRFREIYNGIIQGAKRNLILLAQNDPAAKSVLKWKIPSDHYFLLPWIRPGVWDGYANRYPDMLESQNGDLDYLPLVYGYRTIDYSEFGKSSRVTRYCEVQLPQKQYSASDFVMVADKERNCKVDEKGDPVSGSCASRTFTYYDGPSIRIVFTDIFPYIGVEEIPPEERSTATITENLDYYPYSYQLQFPEGARMTWGNSISTGEMVAGSGKMGAVYYTEGVPRDPSRPAEASAGEEQEVTTSSIRYSDGDLKSDNGRLAYVLEDYLVLGKARDAVVLYDHVEEKDDSTEVVAYITDQGIKFYRDRTNGRYDNSKAIFVTNEELAKAPSNYGLSVLGKQGATEYVEQQIRKENKTQGSGDGFNPLQTNEDQDDIIDRRNYESSSADNYLSTGISLLNKDKVILAGLTDGLIMLNLNNGLIASLKDGAYYSSFPVTDADGQEIPGKFMVVGYNTEEYPYKPSDIAWAKCYPMDFAKAENRLEKDAVKTYLDGLMNTYMTEHHTFKWNEDGTYTVVKPEKSVKSTKTENLFFNGPIGRDGEIRNLIRDLGLSSSFSTEELVEYTESLATRAESQRIALHRIYTLAGLTGYKDAGVAANRFPSDPYVLMVEGYLMNAPYPSAIEMSLVDLALSDNAIASLPTEEKKAEYENYRKMKFAAETSNNQKLAKDGKDYIPGTSREEIEKRQQAMQKTEYYNQVLDDLKARAAASGKEWDSYIRSLFNAINPKGDEIEAGMKRLNELTGIILPGTEEQVEAQKMAIVSEIEQMTRVRQLEELIVSKKITNAVYAEKGYRNEFKKYTEGKYSSQEERDKAFHDAGFYQVIVDLANQAAGDEDSSESERMDDWDREMRNILGRISSGVILD